MKFIRRILPYLMVAATFVLPVSALADWGIVDQLNLAPFVPLMLDAMMAIATGGYEFFVGNGDGIIYLLVWGFLIITIVLYLVKLYLPKTWAGAFGFSDGDSLADGKTHAQTIVYNVMKPCLRGIIAAGLLLQIRPVMLTEILVNPFLQFGALYTHAITETINKTGNPTPKIECPQSIVEHAWISKSSCEFLIQPVSDLSMANNRIIKHGFEFVVDGIKGLLVSILTGGHAFLNIITGIILIATFFSCNLFMALLIIEAIFKFGMALVLYPFHVLSYVAKPNDKWLDIWPAFAGITKEIQHLVITMIMCSFMVCINLAIVKSLFTWNGSLFTGNTGGGFGEHSILWLSSILTFYIMFKLFDLTQKQLTTYVNANGELYNQVTVDTKNLWNRIKDTSKKIGVAAKWIKEK